MKEVIDNFLENIEYKKILVNASVSVGMMSIFLTVFYFYYVLSVEHEMIEDNVNIMVKELSQSIKPFLTPMMKKNIEENLKNPDMKEQDNNVIKSNDKIKSEAIKIMSIICVLGIIIGYGLSVYFNIDFYNIIVSNILIVIILGITEYSFLHILPSKIITGDPNFIIYKVLTNIKNKIILE
jgi:hypothetical protein